MQWGARIAQQLLGLFVRAHDRFLVLERLDIQRQQIVHPLPVLRSNKANAPHQPAPRFEAVFFGSRRIVSRLIGPIHACPCAACSSKTKVQRLAPAGGAERARAVTCASTSVSYCRGTIDACRALRYAH